MQPQLQHVPVGSHPPVPVLGRVPGVEALVED